MSRHFEIGDRVKVIDLGASSSAGVENFGIVVEKGGPKLVVEYDDGRTVSVHPTFVFHAPREITDTEIYGAGA